ncbi:acyl carrier protein [Sorangium sp. So ce1078]|uniref:acyl carrier protein n=1 Tax=Sorangium sp. So ce1078 TaxID=3133329 RepID=UPI003F5F907F
MSQEQSPSAAEIENWLSEVLSELLGIPRSEIDVTTRFDRYGLDSSSAISITEMLGSYVGKDLEPTLLYDYPSVESIAKHLAK